MKVRNTGRIKLIMHLYSMFYYLNCFTTSRYLQNCLKTVTSKYIKYALRHYGGIQNNCLNKVSHHSDGENFDNDNLPIMKTLSYYDTNYFKSLINTKTNNVGVLSTNIQSINAKLNEIEVFPQELRLLNYAFSIICVQEDWLTEHDDLCNIQLEDYTCISLGKTSSTKGGLIVYIQSYKTAL